MRNAGRNLSTSTLYQAFSVSKLHAVPLQSGLRPASFPPGEAILRPVGARGRRGRCPLHTEITIKIPTPNMIFPPWEILAVKRRWIFMEEFSCKTTIIAGAGAVSALESMNGKRLFLVTDPFFMKNGTAQRVAAAAKCQ